MANKQLESLAVSIFCENMAMMLGAGIGAEEAAGLLGEDSTQGEFHDAAKSIQKFLLLQGGTLSEAIAQSGFFPAHVSDMVRVGERAGRTEQTLRSLAAYYAGRSRLEAKLRSAVLYPLVLLVLMTAILAVLLAKVLPEFTGVYISLAGDLTTSSYGYIRVAYAIGWLALAVTALAALALIAAVVAVRTPAGLAALKNLAEHLPGGGVWHCTAALPGQFHRGPADLCGQRCGCGYRNGVRRQDGGQPGGGPASGGLLPPDERERCRPCHGGV